MSKEQEQALEKAGDVIFDNAYIPALCSVLEKRGYAPKTTEEMESVLESVVLLKMSKEKETNNSGNLHKAANAMLHQHFGSNKGTSNEAQYTSIAQELLNNEEIEKAAGLITGIQNAEK
jgi:hypothetical protein